MYMTCSRYDWITQGVYDPMACTLHVASTTMYAVFGELAHYGSGPSVVL